MNILKLNNWGDLPENYTGIFDFCGTIFYYLNGKCHREDGPAIIWKDGKVLYFINDKSIKIKDWKDLPENYTGIVEYKNIGMCYYLNGKYHREDGPAFIWKDGTMFYYLNGKYHREDGPAFIWKDGTIKYFINGKRHREDGPAVIHPDGTVFYYINDKHITKEVNDWIKENNIPKVWDNSHKILFKLTFG